MGMNINGLWLKQEKQKHVNFCFYIEIHVVFCMWTNAFFACCGYHDKQAASLQPAAAMLVCNNACAYE